MYMASYIQYLKSQSYYLIIDSLPLRVLFRLIFKMFFGRLSFPCYLCIFVKVHLVSGFRCDGITRWWP